MEYMNTGINEFAIGNPTSAQKKELFEQGFEFFSLLKNDGEEETQELWIKKERRRY